MMSVDDILDIVNDALTRDPDDPVLQPLFEVKPVGNREDYIMYYQGTTGAVQAYEVPEWGKFRVIVVQEDPNL